MPYVVWTGKDEAGNKTSGADKVRWWVAYRYNLSAGPAPPPENLENRNGWTIWGDACLDPGKRDLKEANVSDPPPRELTNGVERYGDINYPYLSNRHEEWLQYWPNGKNFITQRHLDQLFHGMKVAASVPQYDMKPWQDALDKRFTPEQQGILDRMFYGRLVRPEVNKTALHVWREYLKNNPHIPADRLSQVGLANLRKMPLYGRPFLIYGSFGHGSAGYENGGFGIALGANSGAEYGPISNFVNLVRHEHEHLTQFREAVMTITSETPTVLSHLIGGIKDLQDATGRPYQGGFLGVKKDNFRGPADNEFARNLPGGKTIKLLEKRFGELKPGSGNIQRLLSHDQKFQTAVIGMFQVLLKRHSAKGFALYTQDEIRRDALP